ncbi:hypothetical protein FHX52_0359 [Humibacillus xanthopallidus]|uniref:Uncharacterized protein n=1 Tax=Humibacillus xanthopallidus TaxID=412689 RepID=A0A543PT84_9MICO|nr:hypothetical protein [Humibacillus xanthopallidus]TQN47266.1 hypothetical protein FHX52_0359 [Humibacillus xanthopallidus]
MKVVKSVLVAMIAFGVAIVMANPAAAVAAKFFSVSSSVGSSGALVVSFDERGLGNGDIDYTLTADASAVYACINGGGNHPKAANKETVNGDVTGGGTFQPKNGRVQASLSAGPISAGGFSCPSGQRLVLASVSYTNIQLTDTTNGTGVSVPDTSRVFFAV